jgi:5-hydroxyisourate hydrolase
VSPITCHVLDTSIGRPVRSLSVQLAVLEPDQRWVVLATRTTDADGRITDLLAPGDLQARMYRLVFDTGSYLAASGRPAFYPEVVVTFSVSSASEHYHVPLLLSPFGYSTYRGS